MVRWRSDRGRVGSLWVAVFVSLVACVSAPAGPDWTITQLTNNSYSNDSPDISGTNVVWHSWGGGMYDRYGGIWSNFAGQLSDRYYDIEPAISGTNVVWQHALNSTRSEIWTNFGGQVTDTSSGWGEATPAISGTNVVWSYGGDTGGLTQIYMATYAPDVVPAPGAILLSSIGAGLVSWLRRRRAF